LVITRIVEPSDVMKRLPTPANQSQSGGVRIEGGSGGRKRMRALLPTPTKRDERADEWSPAYDKRKSPSIDALSSKHGRDGTAGLLRLVEWMMGYPRRWLLGAALAVPVSPPTAMPSSRKSQKR
jgi:hypothetical protein